MSKKIKKLRKPRKPKKPNCEKNRLVRFWFYKPKTEKTKLNSNKKKTKKKSSQTGKKQSQTGKTKPNRFEPVFVLKNQTKIDWFKPVSVFLKKNISIWCFFL